MEKMLEEIEREIDMERTVEKIKEAFNSFIDDTYKVIEKGNKTAGVRSRKKSIELAKLLKEWRKVSL